MHSKYGYPEVVFCFSWNPIVKIRRFPKYYDSEAENASEDVWMRISRNDPNIKIQKLLCSHFVMDKEIHKYSGYVNSKYNMKIVFFFI